MMNEEFFSREISLENDRVKLVPFDVKYKEDLHRIIFDEEVYYTIECRTEADFEKYVRETCRQRKLGKSYPFIIIDKRTNEAAGSTRYGHIQFDNMRLEIGWTWYGKEYRGTGLNKACKFELLKYAFEQMQFRRVQFSADVLNLRSQKAISKLGATQEGVFRANYIDASGMSKDDVYYSIIYSEWEDIKKRVFPEFC